MENFELHGEYQILTTDKILYLKMNGSWNLDTFQSLAKVFENKKSNWNGGDFLQITDLLQWEGSSLEALKFDAESTKEELPPKATCIIAKGFQRSIVDKYILGPSAPDFPVVFVESLDQALDHFYSKGWLTEGEGNELLEQLEV